MAPRKYRHLTWVEAETWDLGDAECLKVAEKPDDRSDLTHERAAYEHALQRLDTDVPRVPR